MQRISFAIFLIVGLHAGAASAGLVCPSETVEKGVQTQERTEAWCEKTIDGKTIKHGPYRVWYPGGGSLETSGYYAEGEPVAKWSHWHPNGRLKSFEWFNEGKVVRIKPWDESGQLLNGPAP